ncbi:hypothetical protein [Candidatus Mesenet endosymbiont of Phosphuga atrata]|uniref:hypothetical protein n=1 Tax=Candidatus Mesenet endosymbiont of Phosphuga atrata TaxID=3066221 RepID=UPI0030D44EE1
MKMNFDLKLLDPAYQWNNGSILAKDQNTPKHAEVEINPKSQIKSCINTSKLDDGLISIDTTRHGCDVGKLFNAKNDAFKITLTEGVRENDEFAMLGGTVNLKSSKGDWIDLGLNEWALSNIRVKITKDCAEESRKILEAEKAAREAQEKLEQERREAQEKLEKEKKEAQEKLEEEIRERDACEPDIEAIRDHRYDIEVKSNQFNGKVGSVNLASWFFKNGELYYDLRGDGLGSVRVGEDNIYLKVLPCNEIKKYYKLALCDQEGNIAEKTQKGTSLDSKGQASKTEKETIIYVSKCNLIDGQKIQLKDYYREDEKPSFIIKPSESKDWGESSSDGIRSRAEVYKYNPISHNIGDKIGKLNATDIRVSDNSFIIDNLVLNDRYTTFNTNKSITVYEQDDHSYRVNQEFADAKTMKLVLDDLLCLFDQNLLQDGIQIIG